MKIVKYSEFNQELNESFWDDGKLIAPNEYV